MRVAPSMPQVQAVDLDGAVAFREWPGPPSDGAPTFVCVHGLGGSAANWMAVGPGLARWGRVLAPDLAGFGYTPRAGRRSTLGANRRLLSRFMAEVAGEPVVLVGASMGGTLALLQAAYEPRSVAGVVATDPALPVLQRGRASALVLAAFALYQIPRVGEWAVNVRNRRLGPEGLVRLGMRLVATDPDAVPPEVVEEHIAMARDHARDPDSVPALTEASRSLVRLLRRGRFFRLAMDRIEAPVLLLHGERDRFVPLRHARAAAGAHPTWTFRPMPDTGHAPMIERPERWLAAVEQWLRSDPGGLGQVVD